MTDITLAEWQAEMERLRLGVDDEGQTAQELARLFGFSPSHTQRIISAGVAEGRYVVGYATRAAANGTQRRVPVYRLAKGKK